MNAYEAIVVEALREHTFRVLRDGVAYYSQQHQRIGICGSQDDFCCVLATRIAVDILKEHGIGARAMKVHVLAYNRALWEWEQGGKVGPMPEEKGLLRACGTGRGEPINDGFLNGHCIAVVEQELLLDTSAPQFTTVHDGRRLFVPPLLLHADPNWLKAPDQSWAVYELDEELNGGAIMYRQPEDLSGMFDAPDWNVNTEDAEAAQILSTAVKTKVRENIQRALKLSEALHD